MGSQSVVAQDKKKTLKSIYELRPVLLFTLLF